jgi:uncharacterized protein YegL
MIFKRDGRAGSPAENRLDPSKVAVGDNVSVLPLVLVLDTSLSMFGEAIEIVNDTLARTAEELHRNPSFKYTVKVAMITFGFDGVVLWRGNRRARPDENPFVDAAEWHPPVLDAAGVTPLAEAVTLAVDCVDAEKQRLRDARQLYNRPVIWLWSDGEPTDERGNYDDRWMDLLPKLSRSERRFRLYALYPPSIRPDGKTALEALASHAWPLEHFAFADVLPLLSASMTSASADPGAQDDEIQQIYDEIVMDRMSRGRK